MSISHAEVMIAADGERAPRILLVEDDATVADVVVRYLVREGMEVRHAADGADALVVADQMRPDLVVLDRMLPGLDGLEVCRRLRRDGGGPAIVMLTALGEEADRIAGLEVGADDYVTKPFSPRELVLRVQAVLRRSGPGVESRTITSGEITVDLAARRASRAGVPLALTVREFDLLAFLIAHPGVAFDRRELLAKVWGWSYGDLSTVTVQVRRLREKLETDPTRPSLLATVWGVGYRWDSGAAS
jgi:DNA-binding response OmpR family regulator